MSTKYFQYKMKPIETIFWIGTVGVLYMAANNIVKNVAKDIVNDVFKKTVKHNDHNPCTWW
jgi:hypothetical protein